MVRSEPPGNIFATYEDFERLTLRVLDWGERRQSRPTLLAVADNIFVARAAWERAAADRPTHKVTLQHGMRVIANSRPDPVTAS